MAATLIVMLPLLPGKQEAWRQFCQTLQGSRHHEYKEETHESRETTDQPREESHYRPGH
jgi:hypothetical protein